MTNKSFRARHKARHYALQALYGWSITKNDLEDVEQYFLQEKSNAKFDVEYFHKLLYNIPVDLEKLDGLINPFLKRTLEELDLIELTILRIAAYEFQHNMEIPPKVIINEALILTKTFGAKDSYKFVNGVLDKLAKQIRKTGFKD